jgi:radical SAM superfamily enzyme YgiQ (UPF0313 family)
MKVLLVYGNTYTTLYPPPVGLSLLTEPLRKAGHEVHLVDFMREKSPDTLLQEALNRYKPDIVGFSLRNLDNQDYKKAKNFVPDYQRWVSLVDADTPTIIGGSAVMCMPEEIFQRVSATYAMVGQGERAFPTFLEELQKKKADFTTPGLIWKQDGKIRHNPGSWKGYRDGGTIDWASLDYKRYRKSIMGYCVITKSGCPYNCLFCDAKASFGSEWIPREPETIVEDLRRDRQQFGLHRFGCFFVDALFNEPVDWAKRLLEEIIRSEFKLSFSVIIEPTKSFDHEFARLLRKAGCGMVTTLLSSMDDEVLEKARRPFTVQDVDRTFALLERERVPYMPQFMLGGPGETKETVTANFTHLKRWKPLYVDATYGIRIMPRAGIYEVALQEGIIDKDTDLLDPVFYLSEPLKQDLPWLDRQTKKLKGFRLGSLAQWGDYLLRSTRVRFQ